METRCSSNPAPAQATPQNATLHIQTGVRAGRLTAPAGAFNTMPPMMLVRR